MTFTPLTERIQIRAAFDRFWSLLTRDTLSFERYLGWQGGGGNAEIHWNPNQQFWVSFRDPNRHKRFICLFGFADPYKYKQLHIVCEINPPKKGRDRRCAGMFVKNEAGVVYLAHSGKIGGGRAGIGKSAFLNFVKLHQSKKLAKGASKSDPMIIVGPLGGTIVSGINGFVRLAYKFKEAVKEGTLGRKPTPEPLPRTFQFTPEFSGHRKAYRAGLVRAYVSHGSIVGALRRILRRRGFKPVNDRKRDLLIASRRGEAELIFEVKTRASTPNIYGAIGQLLFHGTREDRMPKLVMVLPTLLSEHETKVLKQLGIDVIRYTQSKRSYAFTGLNALL